MKKVQMNNSKPLNKLSPMEYAEDFKLYLENCDIPGQRNLATYFSEFEHQEGGIREDVKTKTSILVARRVMADFYVEMDNIRAEVQDWVIKMLMLDTEDGTEHTYEDIKDWVVTMTQAMHRGWDKR